MTNMTLPLSNIFVFRFKEWCGFSQYVIPFLRVTNKFCDFPLFICLKLSGGKVLYTVKKLKRIKIRRKTEEKKRRRIKSQRRPEAK